MEYAFRRIKEYVTDHKYPIITGFIIAFLTHGFFPANKIKNPDDLWSLYGYGDRNYFPDRELLFKKQIINGVSSFQQFDSNE